MSAFATAEAIFGSASRGDSDVLSDRDVLIVDSDIRTLKQRQAVLEALGWSVASYTFSKLNTLVKNGSLFIQHLKDEAIILRDVGGCLNSTLNTFQARKSYCRELRANARLADLIAAWPDSRAGALWAADMLYVTTRNFGILYLAEKGRYVFSYSDILEALAEDGVVDRDAIPDLLKLRLAKTFYRSRQHMSVSTTTAIVKSAIKNLPRESFPEQATAKSSEVILSNSVALPKNRPAYHRLRNLERTYLALLELYPASTAHEDLATLAKWIQNPRAYAFFAAKSEDDLLARIQCLAGVRQITNATRIAL